LYTPRPHDGLQHAPPAWNFPNELVTESIPLKVDEIEWLTRDGAESADRRQFQWRGVTGTMILVPSTTWRAHHRPERCFEVYGLQLDESRPHIVTPNFSVRLVSLGQRIGKNLSAAYWFQSATRATDDYGTRLWADVTMPRERWVLVSILFDRAVNSNDADVNALYLALHMAVEESFSPE
jgi:exosortase O